MRYETYQAEDFLSDDSFRKYCLGTDAAAILFWENWIKAHPEKLEETERARQLYYILNGNNTRAQFEADEQKFNARVSQLVNPEPVIRPKGIIRKLLFPAAAACILAAVVLFINQSPEKKEQFITSAAGEHKSILLPDGSKVTLNEKSTIHIAADFNEKNRDITLSGEAFFDVTQNSSKPFIIHTPYTDVNVLGTVLNIKAYPGDGLVETSLLKGSVEVVLKKQDNKRILLKPNERISINYRVSNEKAHVAQNKMHLSAKSLTVLSGEKQDSSLIQLLWNTGTLSFNKSSFAEIAGQLQQWYGVELVFEDSAVAQYRFTGDFKDKRIMEVLNALQLSRHFNYEIDKSNSIIIKE